MKERIDLKIQEIMRNAGCDNLRVFISGSTNFRNDIAVRKAYKGNREEKERPFHYANLKAYLITSYKAEVSDGIEADDLICIAQTEALARGEETVICSRDKDLRQCQGWHYGWECGKQPEKRLFKVEGFGTLAPVYNAKGKVVRLTGTGDKWFLAQLLMGDSTDNIPGLKGWGPVKVLALLDPYLRYETALGAVIDAYVDSGFKRFPEISEEDAYQLWREELTEQAHLVYMIRERNEDGQPKFWRF